MAGHLALPVDEQKKLSLIGVVEGQGAEDRYSRPNLMFALPVSQKQYDIPSPLPELD